MKTDRQADRQREGEEGRDRQRGKEREFFSFACILGWADLTCLYIPRVKNIKVYHQDQL